MTNYKQPHKPNTTDIEEIVDQVMELIETHGLNTSEYAIYWDRGEPEALKSDILQTLKDYGDAVRGETEDDIFKTLKTDKELPNKLPHPIDAIKFRMEQSGLTQNDMTPYFGSKSKTSEVLNLKRELSKKMIRRLMAGLELSAEVLIQEYDLEQQ